MANVGDMVVNILGNAQQFQRTVEGVKGQIDGMVSFAKRAAGVLAAGFTVSQAISGAETQLIEERKLEAVLKATGNAAGLAADEIKAFASERQSLTNFGDEATIAGAAILATFKSISGETFKDAIVAAQGMSTILGRDLNSSIIMVGKSLADPIRGITALQRAGIKFTASQEEQIRTLQKSGDIMAAQAIIIKELEEKFGTAAEAGRSDMVQIKNTLGDIFEEVGKPLLAVMKELNRVMSFLGRDTKESARVLVAFIAGLKLYTYWLQIVKLWQNRVTVSSSAMTAALSGGKAALKQIPAIAASVAAAYGVLLAADKLLADDTKNAAAAHVNLAAGMDDAGDAAADLNAALKIEQAELKRINDIAARAFGDIDRLRIERIGLLFGDDAARQEELRSLGYTYDKIRGIMQLEGEIKKLREDQKRIQDEQLEASRKLADEQERLASKWESVADEARRLAETPVDRFVNKLWELNAIRAELGEDTFLGAVAGLAGQFGLFDKAANTASGGGRQALTAISGMEAISAVNAFNVEQQQRREEAERQKQRDAKAAEDRQKMIDALKSINVPINKLNDKIKVAEAVP